MKHTICPNCKNDFDFVVDYSMYDLQNYWETKFICHKCEICIVNQLIYNKSIAETKKSYTFFYIQNNLYPVTLDFEKLSFYQNDNLIYHDDSKNTRNTKMIYIINEIKETLSKIIELHMFI